MAALLMIVVGLGFLGLGFSKPPGAGGHDLWGGVHIGITVLTLGVGILFLRKWAVLLFVLVCFALAGEDLLDAYNREGYLEFSHILSVALVCLPALSFLPFWKHLKWRVGRRPPAFTVGRRQRRKTSEISPSRMRSSCSRLISMVEPSSPSP